MFNDYGAACRNILNVAAEKPGMLQPVDDRSNLTAAEVVYFTREEMARKIVDVLFRRTNIGWFGYLGRGFIEKCADIMGEELGWDSKRKRAEIDDAKRFFEDLQCRQQLRQPLRIVYSVSFHKWPFSTISRMLRDRSASITPMA